MIETTPRNQLYSDLGIFGAPEAAVIGLGSSQWPSLCSSSKH